MGPGGVIVEPRLTGDFTTAILWSQHLPEDESELVSAMAEALPDAHVKMKRDSKDEMSMFIYWSLPSGARNDLQTANNCLRRFGIDPERLLVCAKTARFDSQFTLSLKIERRKFSTESKIVFNNGRKAFEFFDECDGVIRLGGRECVVTRNPVERARRGRGFGGHLTNPRVCVIRGVPQKVMV